MINVERNLLQSMQELEDCMKSSREYIVFRQRADDADSGWNAHGGTDRISDQTYRRVSDQSLEDPLYREDREGIQELEKKLEDREDCEKRTVLGRRSVMIDPGEIYT